MKRINVILLIIFAPFIAFAQINQEEKTFVDESGKIYWNKNLPVYISLSTSPDGKNGQLMKEENKTEVEPYYLDTEGINWIRTRWATDNETGEPISPQKEVLWPIYADGMPPVTTSKFISDRKFVANGVTYYSGNLKVELYSKDNVSGVEKIYYSTSDTFTEYKEAITIDKQGDWDLEFYAIDNVGNKEKIGGVGNKDGNKFNFTIDTSPPASKISVLDPSHENILSAKSKLNLESTDGESGVNQIYYSFDSGQKMTYSSNISLYNLAEGNHTIEYYAVDQVNNEEKVKKYEFYIDKSAPEVNLEFGDDYFKAASGKKFISERTKLRLESSDNKAGVKEVSYKIDGENYEIFSSPIQAPGIAGYHKISFYGIDKIQNKSTIKTDVFYLDNKAPVINYTTSGPKYVRKDTIYVNNSTRFTLKPYESGDHQSGLNKLYYWVDDENLNEFSDSFTVAGDGNKSLNLKVSDEVNNVSESSLILFLDNTAPKIAKSFSVDKIGNKTVRNETFLIYPTEVKIYLSATDQSVGTDKITYKINGGTEKLYNGPISGFKANVDVTIEVKATDHLGNESIIEFSFSVD